MTFLKLIGPGTLDTPEEKAEYFWLDAEYVIRVAEDIDLEIDNFRKKSETTRNKLENDEQLDPFESHLYASIMVGDAEFAHPSASWTTNSLLKLMLVISDGPSHHKLKKMAEERYDISKLDEPGFSIPSDFNIKGKKPTEYVSGFSDPIRLGVSVLDLEWFSYICSENGIELDEDLVKRTKQESIRYFTGNSEQLSSEVRNFQHSLYLNAARWTEKIIEELGISSFIGKKASNVLRETAEKELSS